MITPSKDNTTPIEFDKVLSTVEREADLVVRARLKWMIKRMQGSSLQQMMALLKIAAYSKKESMAEVAIRENKTIEKVNSGSLSEAEMIDLVAELNSVLKNSS